MCSDIHPKWDNNINKNTRKLIVGTMPPNFVIEKNDKKMYEDIADFVIKVSSNN